MQLVSKNGGLVKKSGSLGTADNAVNFCCCGNCPTCPHLCGYYIEARAGVFAAYPLDPVAPTRVEDNIPFCASGDFLDYDQPGQGAETEGTPGLPSKCGFDTSNVNYSASGVTHQFSMVAQIGAKLAELDQAAPAGSASLNLQCLNGLWTATVEWGVSRIVNNSPVYCSARKTFPIRTGCTADPKICDLPDSEGSNIIGKIFTVTGDSVTVSGLGTIPFRDSDRLGNCANDECLAAWRALWRATFEVKRVPCVGGCSGPCDEANPCPEGCCCIDGQCVTPEEGQCCGPCDEANPCSEGCECVDGECAQACASDGTGCQAGYTCCPQMVDITPENVAVYVRACFDIFAGPVGKCCFNYGNNCIETTRGDCFCSFDGLRGVEVFWEAGLCADGCANPLP